MSELIRAGRWDDHETVQAAAKHRTNAVQEVVDWLKATDAKRDGDNLLGWAARQIESGEWKQ